MRVRVRLPAYLTITRSRESVKLSARATVTGEPSIQMPELGRSWSIYDLFTTADGERTPLPKIPLRFDKQGLGLRHHPSRSR